MARVFISHSSRDGEAADRIKQWLQGQGFDTPFLDFDKHAGITPGSDWEKTLYREVERSEALIIVQTPNWLDSKWCFAEYTQARALGKPIFPVIETPTGETLIAPDIQTLNLLTDREGGLQQLSRELTRIALDAQGGFPWDSSRPPYPGLLAFQEADAALYFGRDDEIRRLIERLNARRAQGGTKLIALLGASGSGKSSLLRAGVIPRIKRDKRNWIVLPPMRPQMHPIDEFARTIAVALKDGGDWRAWRDKLMSPYLERTLNDLASDLRIQAEANEAQILISIDQAEELFGASVEDEAAQFFAMLNTAMSENLPFLAVLAQRSDYLEQLQSAEALTARFEEFSLPPLPLARIPQIIEGPARVAGLTIEDGLSAQAAKDAETDDALPLLAFALRELYDRGGDDNYLTINEYAALGDPKEGLTPLENAVRKAADEVLDETNPSDEQLLALRDSFVPAMVQINDKGEYARHPAQWDELPAKAHPILERLAKSRLLIIRQDGDARMVEVAHEALLRKWPRLRQWLDEAREFLVGRQQLERDLNEWQRAEKSDKASALLTGLKLNRGRGWMNERPHQLSDDQRGFIQASIAKADADERKRLRARRTITQLSIMAALVLAGVAGFAGLQLLRVEEANKQRAFELIRYGWTDLATAQLEKERLIGEWGVDDFAFAEPPQPDGFDCNTRLTSGFRNLYCSVRNVVGYQKAKSISGIDLFVSGPHETDLDFNAPYEFGHYNPAFLDWVDAYLIPQDMNDPAFNAMSRIVYDRKIGPVVRALYHSHEILFASPEDYRAFEADFAAIGEGLRNGTIPSKDDGWSYGFDSGPGKFEDIKASYLQRLEQRTNPSNFSEGNKFVWLASYLTVTKDDDGYLAHTAGGFWVRRSIDGTEAQIFKLLTKVLACFEPEVLGPDTARSCESSSTSTWSPLLDLLP